MQSELKAKSKRIAKLERAVKDGGNAEAAGRNAVDCTAERNMAEGPEYRQAARVQAELNEQTRLLAQARVSAAKAERAGQRRLEAEQQQRLIVEKQLQELQEQQAVAAVVELAVSEPGATNTAAVLQGELRGLRITSETRSVQFESWMLRK
jgi:hypothetical protein